MDRNANVLVLQISNGALTVFVFTASQIELRDGVAALFASCGLYWFFVVSAEYAVIFSLATAPPMQDVFILDFRRPRRRVVGVFWRLDIFLFLTSPFNDCLPTFAILAPM